MPKSRKRKSVRRSKRKSPSRRQRRAYQARQQSREEGQPTPPASTHLKTTLPIVLATVTIVGFALALYDLFWPKPLEIVPVGSGNPSSPLSIPFEVTNNNRLFHANIIEITCKPHLSTDLRQSRRLFAFSGLDLIIATDGNLRRGDTVNFACPLEIEDPLAFARILVYAEYKAQYFPFVKRRTTQLFNWSVRENKWLRGETL